ncbi:uncharacterized protein EAF01_007668 [Botrytis porri]|uniref:uncharacterized protein n=1 Tax=Botrytis porri TaxID=87229 RepID=UPI00190051AA|nr:uncharacterized protein EAF01_007668 [Botrytis porri]KAF7900366.1 hypothetical protein EAF01_007668 [Botrytis porri]
MLEAQERGHTRMVGSEETLYGSNTSHTHSVERVPTGSTHKSHVSSHKFEDPSNLSDIALVNYPKADAELNDVPAHTKPNDALAPETDLYAGIVGWDGQDDPNNPQNFPPSRKWLLLGLISSITVVSPLASSMVAPGVPYIEETFKNHNETLSTFTVTVFLLGIVFGPLFLSPLSEIYGRRPVLCASNIVFCLFQIGCALAPNLTALIIFRFFAGIGGSGCLALGGGVIADLFRREQRGAASAAYTIGPLFGPVIGPICGGFIAERVGWHWIFWAIFCAGTVTTIGIEIFNRETYPPVLIRRKTQKLRLELNRPDLLSCYDLGGDPSTRTVLLNGLLRPLKMLFMSPIVFILSIYICFAYSLLYLLFTTITPVFQEQYGWSVGLCGLAYIGIGIGFFSGLALVTKISDKTVIRMTAANNGIFEPEMRLPACLFFSLFIPITFFWYGWSAEKHAHWIVPVIGLIPFGFGMMGVFIPIQTYIIDSFPLFAASATAAMTASRSLFGALLPLAAPSIYAKLGLGWGNTMLGFIAVAMIPATGLIYKYGGQIRKRYPLDL